MDTALEWSGQKDFVSESLREWRVDGEISGKTRSVNGLTFATIDGAGHFVGRDFKKCVQRSADFWKAPYDKAQEMLALLQRWIVRVAL